MSTSRTMMRRYSEQIVNRIKAKVAARLGEGVNTQDRYFIVPFAYQNKME